MTSLLLSVQICLLFLGACLNNSKPSAQRGVFVAAPTRLIAGQGFLHPVPSHSNLNSLFLSLVVRKLLYQGL